MCEILFSARNDTHANPERDRVMWKRGHAVVVQPDGHAWGRLESKQQWIAEGNNAADWPNQGRLVIVKIPGAPVLRAQELLDMQTVDIDGTTRTGSWDMGADQVTAANSFKTFIVKFAP